MLPQQLLRSPDPASSQGSSCHPRDFIPLSVGTARRQEQGVEVLGLCADLSLHWILVGEEKRIN